MNLDLRTIVLVRRRVEYAPILLHHEVRTPKARAERIARIHRWLGWCGRAVTNHYLDKRAPLPSSGRRDWKRAARELETA